MKQLIKNRNVDPIPEEVRQQFAKDHGENYQVAQSQRNRRASSPIIPNIFAEKVYPIKDVVTFSRLSG